ncbi:MAG: cation-translocating P-type ATPase [Actinomycetes bacterium]
MPVDRAAGDELFVGTFVVEGEAATQVVAVGARTQLAGLAQLARVHPRPPSPLAKELHRLVRTIALVALGIGAALFGLALLLGRPAADGFVLAIGVTVALVPESMLPTVTLSLAVGAQRMADRHALVRRLESVETLGSVTFICTDKTGTLTTNQMAVVEVWAPAGTASVDGEGYEPVARVDVPLGAAAGLSAVALAAGRCSTGSVEQVVGAHGPEWVVHGDAMEAAIAVLAARTGLDLAADARRRPEQHRYPFDPRRRRMSVVVEGDLLCKGAPDSVLPVCRPTPAVSAASRAVDEMAARGLRVLAVARGRAVPPGTTTLTAETDLELLGLLGLHDPPRHGVAAALADCRRAGIRVAMVTGDHPATASAIAQEIGLCHGTPRVLTGDQLPADDQVLAALVDHDGAVLSRIEPEDKLRIARALQSRGHVVAMTGDGVNDGPALQAADIGFALGRTGTDVAREAADLVLLEEDVAMVVEAVRQGRGTSANLRRFLAYHLTDNVAEVFPFVLWSLSAGKFPLMIGVLQVLAIDVGTDTLPVVALGAEQAGNEVLRRDPATGRLLNARVATRAFGVMGPAEAVWTLLAFLVAMGAAGWRPGAAFPTGAPLLAASGTAWCTIVVAQLTNAFACRSLTRPVGRHDVAPNRYRRCRSCCSWTASRSTELRSGRLDAGRHRHGRRRRPHLRRCPRTSVDADRLEPPNGPPVPFPHV